MPVKSDDLSYNTLDMKGKFYVLKVLKIQIKENYKIKDLIQYFDKNLESFNDGTALNPGMGFKVLKKIKYPEEVLKDKELKNFAEELIIIEYIKERYGYKKDLDKKSLKIKRRKEKELLDYKKDYIFIKFPDTLIFKGGKDVYDSIWNYFYLDAKNVLEIILEYNFDPDFFLKILEKFWFKKNKIEDDFTIDFFRDLSTEGEIDYMGKLVNVRQSFDIAKSLPILISFLGKKKPKRGLFDFSLRNNFYSIEIDKNGILVPRQQLGIFKKISSNERALYGCYVIYRIIKYYEKWELLPVKERYISIDFIKSIVDYCETEGYNVFKASIDLIKEYSKLRSEI